MSDQASLDLYADKPLPTFLQPLRSRPPARKLSKPPPRKIAGPARDKSKSPGHNFVWIEAIGQWCHYAMENCHKYPSTPKRERPQFKPESIDADLFIVDPVRPYPEWPLVCRRENALAFATKKEGSAWLAKHSPGSSVYRQWACPFCKHQHFECYPQEVSGTSSGKANRKWNFMTRKGIEFEY